MQTILSHNPKQQDRPRFWDRQFSKHVTRPQLFFDVLLGVIAPILCFIFDPIVFTQRLGRNPFGPDISRFSVVVYLFSAISILTLALWLMLRERSGYINAIFAGILLSGAVFSFLIGILILPLTLIGLILLIGVFGFTPFLTAFVYLRNAMRALNTAKPLLEQPRLSALFLLGAVLVLAPSVVLPWQLNRIVDQSIQAILRGDRHTAESATQTLRYLGWASDLDQLVVTYSRETDQTRKEVLAKAYQEITGKDIDRRRMVLMD